MKNMSLLKVIMITYFITQFKKYIILKQYNFSKSYLVLNKQKN